MAWTLTKEDGSLVAAECVKELDNGSKCRQRCEHKFGAWICPFHRDLAIVRFYDPYVVVPPDPYDLPTGTYDPPGDSKLVFLAGAVTHWWNENWDTAERRAYHAWRQKARYALIEAGHITYAPYEAFKGSWNPKCQAVNDHAIRIADAFVVLSGSEIPSKGTTEEVGYAFLHDTPVIYAPESVGLDYLLYAVDLTPSK